MITKAGDEGGLVGLVGTWTWEPLEAKLGKSYVLFVVMYEIPQGTVLSCKPIIPSLFLCLCSPPSPLGSRPKSCLPQLPQLATLASLPPVQQARFPRGIAFPPHVASPIRSDLSSPAKEWDRLVAGASPLDCLFVGIYYAGGFRARATGERRARRVGIGFVYCVYPGRERRRERAFFVVLVFCLSIIVMAPLSGASSFRPMQGQRGWVLGRARQGTGDDRMGCAQPFLTPLRSCPGWVGPWGWLSDPVFRCYRGR